jgi:hypothetical protein
VIFPVRPGVGALGELAPLVLPERFDADRRKRNGPRRVLGLGRYEPLRSADALERLNHFKLGFIQVNILPAQTEQLATSEAEEQRQDVERGEPMSCGSFQGATLV